MLVGLCTLTRIAERDDEKEKDGVSRAVKMLATLELTRFDAPQSEKKFTHSTNNSTLRSHKRKDGWGNCPGRRGHLLEVR